MHIIDSALALACRVHAGQVDKSGEAYILHPLRLMMQFDHHDEQLVALLHDVVEDGDVTQGDLRAIGLPDNVVTAIDCLSKRQGETYDAFIERIGPNALARKVKIADIRDNLNLTRLPELHEQDLERAAKYHRALMYLSAMD